MDGPPAPATSAPVNGRTIVHALWGLLLAGCYTGVSADADAPTAGSAGDDGDSAPGGDGDGDGSGDDGDDGDGTPAGECDGELVPTVALRFLTRHEYDNTVRDLFGRPMDVTGDFVPDEAVDGFLSNSVRAPSQAQLERFVGAAEVLAASAVGEDLERFAACSPEDRACAETFVGEFGRRAFRRPLQSDEVDAYLADYDALAPEQGGVLALETVATAMLASPNFLYVGARTEGDETLQAYDLASRLSYFLWSTMPDETLFVAAADGRLASAEGVEDEVRRMLDDPRAADTLHAFARQWMEVEDLWTRAPKNPETFATWTPELAEAAELDTARLLADVVQDGDARLQTVLLSRRAWVDDDLADLYGVAHPAGGEGWVDLPEGERAGVLTRAAFVASHSHSEEVSWVHRGKLVRERFLCGTLPPPPPVADDAVLNDDARLEDETCAGCHTLMDPIGFGLDEYDAIGAFTGDASDGTIVGVEAIEFEGGAGLSEALAAMPEVTECFADQMFVFANRRHAEASEDCATQSMREAFAQSDGDIRELMVALATSEAFRGEGA